MTDHVAGRVVRPNLTILAGAVCALLTVTIWAQWIVSTRYAVATHLPVGWLGLIRYGVPAMLLAPFWLRGGLLPAGIDKRLIALMVTGCGTPFFLVVSHALQSAPAAAAGVLLMGVLPLSTAVLSRFVTGETFTPYRLAGFAMSLAAIAMIGIGIDLGHVGYSVLLLPLGATLWASYTLAYRCSGLPAFQAAGIIAAWSALLFLPLVAAEGLAPILAADAGALAWQVLAQGGLSGVVALVAYGFAVSRLGASNTAAFGSLSPALAALMAIPVLGEIPNLVTCAGVVLAVLGVLFASGAVGRRRSTAAVHREQAFR